MHQDCSEIMFCHEKKKLQTSNIKHRSKLESKQIKETALQLNIFTDTSIVKCYDWLTVKTLPQASFMPHPETFGKDASFEHCLEGQ
jgi:hypothetical protein